MAKGDKVSIELIGGPPWGFRLGGGADFGCPLEIAKLRKKSKAFDAGLVEGDVVTSIDHHDVSSKSHGEAMKIIELAGSTLKLDIIKGVGPSAQLINSSMMAESMIVNQSDGLIIDNQLPNQQPLEATVVRSREPSISRSFTEPTRERSQSRTLTILPSSSQKVEPKAQSVQAPKKQTEPWTVDVTSYQFANSTPATAQSNHLPSFAPPQYKQAPPTSPKPKFKATSLANPPASNSCPLIPSWGAPPVDPSLKHVWQPSDQYEPVHQQNAAKPAPMFKVSKIDSKNKAARWQPTAIQSVDYNDPRHRFNSDGMMLSPIHSVASVPSYREDSNQSAISPRSISTFVPVPPPPPPPHPAQMSPRKHPNHIPGMVNPLICDDSQGDFGANPIVRPDTKDSADEAQKQKKMYSDSAFYDAPGMEYPTIHEQVALCKEIASFLESSHNKRSKGGRMFMKRKQRSEEWSMDSQGQRRDMPQSYNYDLQATESMKTPYHPLQRRHFGYNAVRHHPDPIQSKLTAAELEQIQHDQDALCKHDSLPPNIAFDINEALSHSRGKAGQIFEKRRQRAEKYVVDENSAQNWPTTKMSSVQMDEADYPQQPYVSPWQAAMEGRLDMGFPENPKPSYNSNASPQVSRVAPSVQQPLNVITNYQEQPSASKLNVKYKTFRSVNAPADSINKPSASPFSNTLPRAKTRLEQMLSDADNTSNQSNYSNTTTPIFSSSGMRKSSFDSYSNQPVSYTSSPTSSLRIQTGQTAQVAPSSSFTLNLRRPKDYVNQSGNTMMMRSYPDSSSVSAF